MFKEAPIARCLRLAFSGGLAGMALFALTAQAQEVTQTADKIEITGSAIKRIDAETSVPVTVIKIDDLKKEGITTIEQVMATISAGQSQQGTSQVVGASTGGASFANLRGLGQNKTLVLLNGRRLANNAYDSSAPDLNMIPFAALERVEVLRDGASALYGSDAVGGVINFITRKDYTGTTITFGADSPQHPGGKSSNFNIGTGFGNLSKDGFNVFAMLDHQEQNNITGTDRPYNTRYAGGISTSTNPANYYQGGGSANPAAPTCASGTDLVPQGVTSCKMTTSSFVDYIPKSERTSGLLKGTVKIDDNNELGLEYLYTESKVGSQIAPVPYGGLYMNRLRPDGSLNPYYPGNPGAITPGIALDPNFTQAGTPAGVNPGFIHVKWRDLPNGPRADRNTNDQQRFVASLTGSLIGWDYEAAATYNENKVQENLKGYSDGSIISAGVLNGIINPFGAQSAAGTALLASAALDGNLENAVGRTYGIDWHASRELGDYLHAGKAVAIAIGAEGSRQKFEQKANFDYATKVVSSTGVDPTTDNAGSRDVYAAYAELNVPVFSTLDVTAAVRYDKYSDFGNTTNPKASFRFQPVPQILIRGSYSTGFRAPSLYDINAAQTYGNTNSSYDDPVNCPGGTAIAGKSSAANCQQQFQALYGGNKGLQPETSENATLGIVIQPTAELSFGLDLWSISLKHTIGSLSQDDIFGNPIKYAGLFHRNSLGDLSIDGSQCPGTLCGYVDDRTQNLGGTDTNGVDLTANYKLRAGGVGTFVFALNSTFVNKYEYQNTDGGAWNQNVGVFSGTGPIFRWQHNASVNWSRGQFAAGLAGNYKSGYLDEDGVTNVSSYATFDTYGSWAMKKGLGITVGVRNLTDRVPPLSYQTQVFQAGYDPRYTDPTGRTYYVRGTYNF